MFDEGKEAWAGGKLRLIMLSRCEGNWNLATRVTQIDSYPYLIRTIVSLEAIKTNGDGEKRLWVIRRAVMKF